LASAIFAVHVAAINTPALRGQHPTGTIFPVWGMWFPFFLENYMKLITTAGDGLLKQTIRGHG
jgi:hypothetical protein